MSDSKHFATFTWGAGPQTVCVAGGFNNWSGDATHLEKQADGTFSGKVGMPWGEKQAFKYVVDGEWKVREDEAKEWDAAGNMNNVYTAPHAPAPAPVAAAVPAHTSSMPAAAAVSSKDAAPAPATEAPSTASKTEPAALLAASAPAAASSGSPAPKEPYVLAAPAVAASAPATATKSVAAPSSAAGTTTTPVAAPAAPAVPANEQISKLAATTTVGEAQTNGETGVLEQAAAFGATAAAALGAIVGRAAVAAEHAAEQVEKAVGVDILPHDPMTVEEAKAKGINVDGLATKDAPTDAVSPVGSKPPAGAADALGEKLGELKRDAPVSTVTEPKENDIPAQNETKENHTIVPMPVIIPVTDRDPAKDRSLASTDVGHSAGAKPVSTDPADSSRLAKIEAEKSPATAASGGASDVATAVGSKPATDAPVAASASTAAPTATPATGVTEPGPLAAGEQIAAPDAKAKNIESTPAAVPAAAPATPAKADAAPSTPVKDAAVAPVTPAKTHPAAVNGSTATPASARTDLTSSPASKKTDDKVRRKKSSFFGKIKSAFSPKDKEKK